MRKGSVFYLIKQQLLTVCPKVFLGLSFARLLLCADGRNIGTNWLGFEVVEAAKKGFDLGFEFFV
jgi:hypothetical protein